MSDARTFTLLQHVHRTCSRDQPFRGQHVRVHHVVDVGEVAQVLVVADRVRDAASSAHCNTTRINTLTHSAANVPPQTHLARSMSFGMKCLSCGPNMECGLNAHVNRLRPATAATKHMKLRRGHRNANKELTARLPVRCQHELFRQSWANETA